MYQTIRSHKWQEPISYYPEDIDYWSEGIYCAPGVGDHSGAEYDLYFKPNGTTFVLTDIRLHNT